MSKPNLQRFKELPPLKQQLVNNEIDKYLKSPEISMADLVISFSEIFGHKFNNKSVARLLSSLNIPKKSPELIKQSKRIKSIAERQELDQQYYNEQKNLFTKNYSKQQLINIYNSHGSLAELQRMTGLTQHYVAKLLTEWGVDLKPQEPTASYVIDEIYKAGYTTSKLKAIYHSSTMTVKEFSETVSNLVNVEITPRLMERIIRKLDLIKPESLANETRRKFSITNDTANLGNNNIPRLSIERLNKLGFAGPEDLAEFYKVNKNFTYKLLAKHLNETAMPGEYLFTEYWLQKKLSPHLPKEVSRLELSVQEALKNLINFNEVELNLRNVLKSGRELDVYIPRLNLAFEINGEYWHSDKFMLLNHGLTAANYHYNKVKECADLGIDLHFIWENDWNNQNLLIIDEIRKLINGENVVNKKLSRLSSTKKNLLLKRRIEREFREYIIGRDVLRFGVVVDYVLDNGVLIKVNGFADEPYKLAVSALENDTTLMQFYEWDDVDAVVALIAGKVKPLVKISAHSLVVKELDYVSINKFLKRNHFQGAVARSGEDCFYGLFDGERLLAVASFAKPRFNSRFEYEFVRYAVDRDYIIYGGIAKMFKFFVKSKNPVSIISYVDLNHTTRRVTFLNSLGFQEVKRTGKNKLWFRADDKKVVSRGMLMRKGADILLKTNYGPMAISGLNNEEIMFKEGFKLYSTAGNRVFTWHR